MNLKLPVREAPKVVPGTEPYRTLFPIGIGIGLYGVGLWLVHAAGWIPYPGAAHSALLIQGFQQSFILGFLMTAMPAFLHAPHCHRGEQAAAVSLLAAFAVLAALGWVAAAEIAYVGTLLVPVFMVVRRVLARQAGPPPEEFALVAAGFATGIVGAIWTAGAAAGLWTEPVARYGLRLVAYGTVLMVVLGVGGLLVPTFMAMKEPLTIPGLAKAHERGPRRVLYATIIVSLLASLALEAAHRPVAGAWTRALVGSVVLLWVWKIFRTPGRADRLSFALWSAGWLLFAGLWAGVLFPLRPLVGAHIVFIGGFGFLTLGIATRVVVRHGGHPLPLESRVIGTASIVLLGAALVARVAAEAPDPASAARTTALAVAAAAWIGAWGLWGSKAIPLVRRRPERASLPPR
ncbi:MAG TPA: NnrS family protein [Acidobacteriota bacterium]|nr:NnrS family protein [Acidobacteriota bacterium]